MTGVVVLAGVAVSAVTGCVAVRGKDEPHRSPDAGPSRQDEGPGAAGTEPRMGRPSLREALSEPSREPSRTAPAAAPGASDAGPVHPRPDAGAAGLEGLPEGSGTAGRRESQERKAPAARPTALPGLPGDAGVCDLGRRYGGWGAGSTPQEACERAYGR